MARPPKKRFVKHRISYKEFGPLDIAVDSKDESKVIVVTADQLEAVRLADLEGMSHNEAADFMKVSRQTFGRIIEHGRQLIANALINGKVVRLECDSTIEFIDREVKCIECGQEWLLSGNKSSSIVSCRSCGSEEVIKRARCGQRCECPLRVNK